MFPTTSAYSGGHEAFLRVDGDAQSVLDGYVRQAEELGFSFEREAPGGQMCSAPERGATEDELLACTAIGVRGRDSEAIVSLRVLTEPGGQGLIHLTTYLTTVPSLSPFKSGGPIASVADIELAPGLTPENYGPPLRVVEGSALVVGPIEQSGGGGGYVAMLEVPGELLPVVRGYEKQIPDVFSSQGLLGDEDEPRVVGDAAGGGDIVVVGVAGDPSYVLIAVFYSNG